MAKIKYVFDPETGTMQPESKVKKDPAGKLTEDDKPKMSSVDLTTVKPNVDMNENIVQFKENSDLTIIQIIEERSRKPMMIIAGYGLEIKFNMAELRTTEHIEQLLGGLSDLFRKMIVEQALTKSDK